MTNPLIGWLTSKPVHRAEADADQAEVTSDDRPGSAETLADMDLIDEASRDSFPASDAPGWTTLAIGPPLRE